MEEIFKNMQNAFEEFSQKADKFFEEESKLLKEQNKDLIIKNRYLRNKNIYYEQILAQGKICDKSANKIIKLLMILENNNIDIDKFEKMLLNKEIYFLNFKKPNKHKLLEELNDIVECSPPCSDCFFCNLDTVCDDEITGYGKNCMMRNLQRLIEELESEE